uniref:Uncharacterized protein n=1 Tax=Parascaris univalens TaxID=6257 RepID=A0A914ZFQ1_PARUN
MRAVLFVVIASILSAFAYSPLRKQPPSRLDIYEEDKRKSNDRSILRANFVIIGDAMKNQANVDTTLHHGERRVHQSERITDEPHKVTNEFPDLMISTGDSSVESETIFDEVEVPERYEKEVAMSSLTSNATALNTLADDLAEDLQSSITKELDEQLAI